MVAAGSAALIMAVSGYLGLVRERAELNQVVRARSEVVLDLLVALATPALVTYDYYSLDPYMEILQRNPDILHVTIRDNERKIVREAKHRSGSGLDVARPIMASGQRVGEVSLSLSVEAVSAAARRATVATALQTVLTFFLVSGATYATFALLVAVPLSRLGLAAQRIAAGDLTEPVRVDRGDEIGALAGLFASVQDRLHEIIGQVRVAARSVAGASAQLSASAAHLSASAQDQAASLEETAASLERVTGTVRQNADSAGQASQVSAGARSKADEGGAVAASAVASMRDLTDASRRIAEIIGVIDDMTFQTNLLALNAAVEAARAGEQGRGFAVVAAEVRNLAQRSAVASREIKILIHDSVGKVRDGSALVERSGQALRQMVVAATEVADIVAEIAAASREQSREIEQVNTAVIRMDGRIQETASQTEEMASTAEALADQARELEILIGRFKLDANPTGVVETGRSGRPAPVGTLDRRTHPAAAL